MTPIQSVLPSITPVLPEIVLSVGALLLVLWGAWRGERSAESTNLGALGLLIFTFFLVVSQTGTVTTLNGAFIADPFARVMKALILIGSAATILLSRDYFQRERIDRFEFSILIVLSTIGMMVVVSANDLIALYLGLELQSLSLYVVAAFRRDSLQSTEAGLKYFVLGALSSGMLLYGVSLVYGFAGTTTFPGLAAIVADQAAEPALGLVFGLVFIAAGLAFKVAAAPFHMWTPDVYEGSPTPVTAFFSVAPKVAATALLVRVMIEPFGPLAEQWWQIIWVTSVLSMCLGAFAAINQTNIKRLMAYSSIGHIGYALVGLAPGDETGVRGVLIYIAIYIFMNVATFAVILCMKRDGKMVERISDLSGLARSQPMVAAALAVCMFSMSGIPPLAGFFSKLYVFLAAVAAAYYWLAVIGVLTSVVAAFYYLRIVKLMYFDEPAPAFDRPLGTGVSAVLAGTSLFTLLFFVYPAPLLSAAAAAAASLFGN